MPHKWNFQLVDINNRAFSLSCCIALSGITCLDTLHSSKIGEASPPRDLVSRYSYNRSRLTLLIRVAVLVIRGFQASVWDHFDQVWCIRAPLSLLRVVMPNSYQKPT